MFNVYRVSNPNYSIDGQDAKVLVVTSDEEKAVLLGSAKMQEFSEVLDFWDPALLRCELIVEDVDEVDEDYATNVILK